MLSTSQVFLGIALAGSLSGVLAQSPNWSSLNTTVGGRLALGTPFAQPCFSDYNGQPQVVNQAACSYVEQNFYNSHLNRSNFFGGYAATNWEMCMSTLASCELDFTNPDNVNAFAPPKDCQQGSVPSYYIDISGPSDILAGMNFATSNNIPLVIKNTGHDYQGRSSAPGSLALWMHNLKGMTYNPAFVAEGCPSTTAPQIAITYQAGQQFAEIFQFAHDNGVTVVGGSDQSVGMAGGWSQGGGHSPLSNTYGLGVDRVLQYKVITTDGVSRIANACQNSDLFWALRGGGGGTFGIVMESTSMASPETPNIVANLNWPATLANTQAVTEVFLQNATNFALQGWGGYLTPTQGNIIFTNPRISLADGQAAMQALFDLTTSLGGTSSVTQIGNYYDFFNNFVQGIAGTQDPVGTPNTPVSRLIPQSLHNTAEDRANLLDGIMNVFNSTAFSQIHLTTPYGFNGTNGSDTSVTPVWRSSLYQVLGVNLWLYNATEQDLVDTYAQSTAAITPLRNLTPGGGAYNNEADIHEPDWQQSFWGGNYDQLLAIKNKYDPNHVLDCWHCIGWTSTLSKYSCYI